MKWKKEKAEAAVEKSRRAEGKAAKLQLDKPYTIRLTVTLLGITVVTALLLGIVNYMTAPIIEESNRRKTEAAMQQVLAADSYQSMEGFPTEEGVTSLSEAISNGETVGYVCEVTSSGFGGEMSLVVGVDLNCRVTGVSVVTHSETKNIGTKVVESQEVLDRFVGLTSPITVNSGEENRFDAVSGATFSSRGVADGVNAALDAVAATVPVLQSAEEG